MANKKKIAAAVATVATAGAALFGALSTGGEAVAPTTSNEVAIVAASDACDGTLIHGWGVTVCKK
jgi:hypothetical protein